ncbi:transmembrane protein 180-like [Clytia hemisphaerica]
MVPVHIAYGGLALFISLLNNVFLLFYVTTFLTVFEIDSTSFYIGETIFLVWNSINDPLFGWLSDHNVLENKSDASKDVTTTTVLKRINILSKVGPIYSACFLLFWFRFLPVWIQFSVALCLYDSFLTLVDLHHQALLADLAIEAKDRVKLNSYCSMFSAIGSVSVFLSFSLWRKDNLFPFQLFCVALALVVAVGFHVCCKSMKQYYLTTSIKKRDDAQPVSKQYKTSFTAMKKYTCQLYRHHNFLVFSVMNFLQVFHCHFNSNFFPLFIQNLLGHKISQEGGAALLGLSFLVPHINNLYFLQLCKRYGVYFIIKVLFMVKVSLALCMWHLGVSHWYLLCLFIMSNRIFTEGTCKLLNLVISDLVDEDYVKFKRSSPVSALVFGTAAFLSKPGQTLAPVLGSYLLYAQTGKSLFLKQSEPDAVYEESSDFSNGCFFVMVMVSIICGLLQLLVWKFFSLKEKYLQQVKNDRYYMEKGYHSNVI